MSHENAQGDGSLGGLIKKAIKTEQQKTRAKTALKAIATVLRKNGVSQKAILAAVGTAKKGKKVTKKHDGTFEIQDIDSHDEENDIDTHDEDVGGVRDEEDGDIFGD
jgi:hypothetical protein